MENGPELRKKVILINDLKSYLENEINGCLFRCNLTDVGSFLCSSYIASTICQYVKSFPVMWRAAEELWRSSKEEGYNPYELEAGGKKCFIICVFFPELRKRWVGKRYYLEFGASLFFLHHLRTNREISYHMASRFDELVELTKDTISASV